MRPHNKRGKGCLGPRPIGSEYMMVGASVVSSMTDVVGRCIVPNGNSMRLTRLVILEKRIRDCSENGESENLNSSLASIETHRGRLYCVQR